MQMINVRVKFSKGNEVKYISHLDLMRTFMRVIRRANIPIAYSGGYNPHPEMSFGAPLSLGVISMAEYVDITLEHTMDLDDMITRLNLSMPIGIKVLGASVLPESFKSAMALITHAKYTIYATIEKPDLQYVKGKLIEFLNQESIIGKKRQPKKNFEIKEFDIKPMILEMTMEGCEDGICTFNCLLLSGSQANLKPEVLIQAFVEYAGIDVKRIKILRNEVYAEKNGKLLDLLKYENK